MFCHCVLLDEAMASWENFSCVFCLISLLIVSKLSGVCLFCSVVPFLPVGQLFHFREIECIHNRFNSKDCKLFLGITGTFYEFQKV